MKADPTYLIRLACAFACAISPLCAGFGADAAAQTPPQPFELMEATVPQLQAALEEISEINLELLSRRQLD